MTTQVDWEYQTVICVEQERTVQDFVASGWEIVTRVELAAEERSQDEAHTVAPLIQLLLRRPPPDAPAG